MTHPFDGVDLRAQPERHQIGRGGLGVFHADPYKGELLPLWTIVDVGSAQGSIRAAVARFEDYKALADFVGMDMAHKYLHMGFTRPIRSGEGGGGGAVSRRLAQRCNGPGVRTAEGGTVHPAAPSLGVPGGAGGAGDRGTGRE